MKNPIRLKNCPFCGSDLVEHVVSNNSHFVVCQRCKCRTRAVKRDYYGDDRASEMVEEMWNRRASNG